MEQIEPDYRWRRSDRARRSRTSRRHHRGAAARLRGERGLRETRDGKMS